MLSDIGTFERTVRRAWRSSDVGFSPAHREHPFDARNIHPSLPSVVRQLFDDGHYPHATLEAYKFLDKEVQRHAKCAEFGTKLMLHAFATENPAICLTPMSTETERNEQRGYQHLFAGAMLAIRDPRAHECFMRDDPDRCLDQLSFVSLLLRRLAEAGYS